MNLPPIRDIRVIRGSIPFFVSLLAGCACGKSKFVKRRGFVRLGKIRQKAFDPPERLGFEKHVATDAADLGGNVVNHDDTTAMTNGVRHLRALIFLGAYPY